MKVHTSSQHKTSVLASVFIAIIFFSAYMTVNHWPMERYTIPLTGIDLSIPYLEWTFFIYLSVFIQAVFVILQIPKDKLATYIAGPSWALMVGLIFFFVLPIEYPRDLYPDENIIVTWFRIIDRAGNCFPSLHVAMTIIFAHIYALINNKYIIRSSIMWVWSIFIIVSVLTTKQHYVVDVFGGIVMGIITIFLIKRIDIKNKSRISRTHTLLKIDNSG